MRRLPLLPVAMIALLALLVPVLPLPVPTAIDVAHRMAAPSGTHWLGQDEFGRDVLSRLLWGARVSLGVAAASAGLACVLGTALGVAGGFLGGLAELLAVRGADVVLCFPPLLLALLVVTLLGPGVGTLIPVLALVYLPGFVRVAYAGTLGLRGAEYVEAQRVLGAGRLRIMGRTVLPNVGGPVLVQLSLTAASAVVLESGLSFLGLGVVPPAPSWGLMIASARSTMAQAPLLLLWPCLALSLTILCMNALCDAVRDAVDPHAGGVRRRRALRLPALPPGLLPGSPPGGARGPALVVRNLTVEIDTPAGPIRPVRDVSLEVARGETLAVVGESGSGKSMTGLAVMGLLPPVAWVAAGVAFVAGTEVLRLSEPALRRLRGRQMAMVFQDPLSSLNPVHRVGAQIAEAVRVHRGGAAGPPGEAAADGLADEGDAGVADDVPPPDVADGSVATRPRVAVARGGAWRRAVALLREVGVPDPARRARGFPHEMSGGMRQRAMIAMAVAHDPALLIADEPTTALDVTIQAQVLELMGRLRRERGVGVVFVTHALPVVAEVADRVAVMYAGEVVEQGAAAALFARPLHPYTAALLRSAPPEGGGLPEGIAGTVPLPHLLPPGCAFAPRCAHRVDACEAAHPALEDAGGGRLTRCLRWRELAA